MRLELGSHSLRVDASGPGPPHLVCLHGLADSLSIWTPLAAGLAELGGVVLVDQRAHGASSAPPGPYERLDLARDVIAVLDRLRIERAVLIGHSLGGIVAMQTAVTAPQRVQALIVIGAASQVSARAADWYRTIAATARAEGIGGLRRAIFGPQSTREIVGDPTGMAEITLCLASLHDDPLTPKLGALRCPALVLVGDKDTLGTAASEIIHGAIPGSRLQVMEGRHWLHVERPGPVLDSIRAFLAAP
jgi:pimeloyl-ACP methyl ester carboxylesterase